MYGLGNKARMLLWVKIFVKQSIKFNLATTHYPKNHVQLATDGLFRFGRNLCRAR